MVGSVQHASLEYDSNIKIHSFSSLTTEGSSKRDSSSGAQMLSVDQNDFREELVLTEKMTALENENQQLQDNLEKLELVDKSKDKIMNLLRQQLIAHQQTTISGSVETAANANLQIKSLKTKLAQVERNNALLEKNLANANEKLFALKNLFPQKNVEPWLSKMNVILSTNNKQTNIPIEKLKTNLQFEVDKNEIIIEEITFKVEELNAQLKNKEEEYAAFVGCIFKLCEDINQHNTVLKRIILNTEDSADNITQAVSAVTNMHYMEGTLSQIGKCKTQQSKDRITSLMNCFDQSIDTLILLLKKFEALVEVISHKDALLEESAEEKEAMRQELQDSITLKMDKLSQLEQKYTNLEKASNFYPDDKVTVVCTNS